MAVSPPGADHQGLWVLLILPAILVGSATAPVAGFSSSQSAQSSLAVSAAQIDADAVLLAAEIQSDGTAIWRVEYRVRLNDESTTEAFQTIQADVEANESAYVSRFEDRMAPTVEDAAVRTGREMTLRNINVTTTTAQLPQSYGVLVYTFEWTNFAVVEDGLLRAGDALAGLFLDEDSALLIAWPEGYEVSDVSPPPTEQRERSVIWRGPIDFGPGDPDLVVSKIDRGIYVDTSLVGIAVVLLVLLGGGVLWWRYGTARESSAEQPAGRAGDGEPATPGKLLSNEERVIALLESHGGRMKQQTIVENLGWTDAKTSQVVGNLREAGRVEGFRLGRENVLRLPDVDEPVTGVDEPPAERDHEG